MACGSPVVPPRGGGRDRSQTSLGIRVLQPQEFLELTGPSYVPIESGSPCRATPFVCFSRLPAHSAPAWSPRACQLALHGASVRLAAIGSLPPNATIETSRRSPMFLSLLVRACTRPTSTSFQNNRSLPKTVVPQVDGHDSIQCA